MSTPYQDAGRTGQKRRTHAALVQAARQLVAAGETPTVDDAAARAGVARSTAYRYFPRQRELLAAAHPETTRRSMLPPDAPDDPVLRLQIVVAEFTGLIAETEAQQRTMLRMSLEPEPASGPLPLRQGRAIGWIEEALEPLRGRLSDRGLRSLVLAIRAATGIEALVWLTDIGRLTRPEAVASMRWSAAALLEQALRSGPPPLPGRAAAGAGGPVPELD